MKLPAHALVVLLPVATAALEPLSAQDRTVLPPGVKDLPIGFAPGEREIMYPKDLAHVTPPPLGPARAAAEWDESIGVFCLWPNADLMNALQQDNDLYIITTSAGWWDSWLASKGIPTTNVHYLNAPTDTFWVRDYGPWFLWDKNHDFGLVDIEYNRPRPLDDAIPPKIGQAYGVPVYGADLIHTGGNYYADGFGNAWSTRLPYKENPSKTPAEVDQIMSDYLGIERYVARDVPYDIQHFDTFGKILAPDVMIWGAFPVGTTPWTYCEAALAHYESLQSAYGWPYEIHRMPLWSEGSSWTAYINSLMTMNKIVMPRYDTAHDAQAKQIYENAVPGYQVVAVDDAGTKWGDSVHCRTRNFVRGDALRIYAQPHWKLADDGLLAYEVGAEVIPDNSTALAGNPVIRWTVAGGSSWSTETMFPTGSPHEYRGSIPGLPPGSRIAYYIEASDLAGRTKVAPPVAPAGTFGLRVLDDQTPPTVVHTAIHGLLPAQWPHEVSCTARDDTGIPSLVLEYAINGVPQAPVAMSREDGTFRFTGTMSGAVSMGDLVSYRLTATDGAAPANVSTCPSLGGWNVFPIADVKTVRVVELDATPDSGAVWQALCDDLGISVELSNEWPADLSTHDVALISLGMNPAKITLTSAQANALVGYLNAGGAAYLEGGDAWAQATTSSIYRSWFGVGSATSGANISPPIVGSAGTLAAGMSFGYDGPGKSSDHLTAAPGATRVLASAGQGKLITHSTGTYQAVGSSLELGRLVDGASPTRAKLLGARLLDHLGMDIELVVHRGPADPLAYTLSLDGSPGAAYWVAGSLAPGWFPLGTEGIVRIDLATLMPMYAGLVPAGGELAESLSIPPNPKLAGIEVYLQAFVENPGGGQYHLTNRDRLTVSF